MGVGVLLRPQPTGKGTRVSGSLCIFGYVILLFCRASVASFIQVYILSRLLILMSPTTLLSITLQMHRRLLLFYRLLSLLSPSGCMRSYDLVTYQRTATSRAARLLKISSRFLKSVNSVPTFPPPCHHHKRFSRSGNQTKSDFTCFRVTALFVLVKKRGRLKVI